MTLRAHVTADGEYAFWEVHCPHCGARILESLHYATSDCESCREPVEVDRGGGEA